MACSCQLMVPVITHLEMTRSTCIPASFPVSTPQRFFFAQKKLGSGFFFFCTKKAGEWLFLHKKSWGVAFFAQKKLGSGFFLHKKSWGVAFFAQKKAGEWLFFAQKKLGSGFFCTKKAGQWRLGTRLGLHSMTISLSVVACVYRRFFYVFNQRRRN